MMASIFFNFRDSCTSYILNWLPSPFVQHNKFPNLHKEKWLKFFTVDPNGEIQQKITKFMSKIIPFWDLSIPERVGSKAPEGFKILKATPLVFIHEDLNEYVLKAPGVLPGVSERKKGIGDQDFPVTNLERISMNYIIQKVISEKKLDKLYTPQKKLARLPTETWSNPDFESNFKRWDKEHRDFRKLIDEDYQYIVVAERLDLTNKEETQELISKMDHHTQKQYLGQLFTLAFHSGYSDMHFWNFAFIKSGPNKGKMAIYDTETHGLSRFHSQTDKIDKKLGYLRETELQYALLGINQAQDKESGLFFDKQILKEVAAKFIKAAEEEKTYNVLCRSLVPLAIIITATAFLALAYLNYSS